VKRYLFYVRGSRPYAQRHWSKAYLTPAVARSQAARYTSYGHDHGTDWIVRIFEINDDPFELTEIPA